MNTAQRPSGGSGGSGGSRQVPAATAGRWPPVAQPVAPSKRVRLRAILLLTWFAGFLSTLGIGMVRGTASNLVSGGGGIAAIGFLVVLVVATGCEVASVALLQSAVRRLDSAPERPEAVATAVWTLALGGVGMIALNLVLVSGPVFFPPFGPVSVLLLCLPYPLALTLLQVRRPRAVRVALLVAALLAAGVCPLRAAQEQLAARTWIAQHPGTARDLLMAVHWPGGEQSPMVTGRFGVQVTVFFQDTNIDGDSDAVVTVSPASADPCGPLAVIANLDTAPNRLDDEGQTIDVPLSRCAPAGPDAWTLSGPGFTGYAERHGSVLLTLSADRDRAADDLPAIARTLHPLDSHGLWPYLTGGRITWSWLLE